MGIKKELAENEVLILVPEMDQIDCNNSDDVKQELLQHLRGATKAVLDLGNVSVIDSSGVGLLLSTFRAFQKDNGTLKICSPQKSVKILLDLVHLNKLLKIFASREEAVQSFS